MNKNILNYIEECEAWKVGIKNLHWSADNLSQHELCDDIASEISDFEDLVSEVEQSISGKIKLNGFTPKSYKITSLKSFVEDVISASQSFLKKLGGMGEKYVGIKSECETFIGTMQRKLYLVNFTLKEDLKRRLKAQIDEGYRKEENIRTIFPGTKPTSDGGILKRLDAISSGKNGQFNSRSFDSMEDAFEFFQRNLEKVGALEYKGNVDDTIIVSLNAENGKSYKGMIDFIEVGDGKYKASIKFSNLGKEVEENDFEDGYESMREENLSWNNKDLYWDKDSTTKNCGDRTKITREPNEYFKNPIDNDREMRTSYLQNANPEEFWKNPSERVNNGIAVEERQFELTESELKQVVEAATMKLIREYGESNDNNLDLMIQAALRALKERCDPNVYFRVRESLERAGCDRKRLQYFQNKFEELSMKNENREIELPENELKSIVKEATIKLINEYNKQMAKTRGFIKSTHGHRKKREATLEDRAETRRRLGIKEPEEAVVEGSIKIAKNKKGTFKAAATKHNMGVQEFANEVLANPEKYSPEMAEKANFARSFGKKK